MALADELVKRLGADAVCERLRRSHKILNHRGIRDIEGKYRKYELAGQRSLGCDRSVNLNEPICKWIDNFFLFRPVFQVNIIYVESTLIRPSRF